MNDSLFDLSGRIALVTGASRGLGQYFARALARSRKCCVVTVSTYGASHCRRLKFSTF
jgi:NAD(P)-dependent dehydrogenase (short-subunit alcohol dehydrogenase family)